MDKATTPPNHHFAGLTKYQIMVAEYLREHKENFYIGGIANGTGLDYCIAKQCFHALQRYGVITRPKKTNKPGRGKMLKVEFLDETFVSDNPTDEQKEKCIKDKLGNIIQTHSEFGFWRQKGLTAKQAHAWHNEFGTPYKDLQMSLRYCAFDMVFNNIEEKKEIRDPIAWFYSIIQRRGGDYPKPENYKDAYEREAERIELRAKEKARTQEMLRIARLKEEHVDHEIAFEKMLADSDGDMYHQCLDKISELSKTRRLMNGMLFTMEMRKAYGDIHGLEGFSDPKIQDAYLEKLRGNNPQTNK